jgi:hypothetical protein
MSRKFPFAVSDFTNWKQRKNAGPTGMFLRNGEKRSRMNAFAEKEKPNIVCGLLSNPLP